MKGGELSLCGILIDIHIKLLFSKKLRISDEHLIVSGLNIFLGN